MRAESVVRFELTMRDFSRHLDYWSRLKDRGVVKRVLGEVIPGWKALLNG